MTVLTQALWMGLDMLRRSRAEMTGHAVEAMRIQWYREAVAGLQPERAEGAHIFTGSARRFSGLTTGAPTENLGATLPVTFELDYDAAANETRLRVGVAGSVGTKTLLAWPGRTGEFAYLDEAGQSHESWPPAGGTQHQLPRVIVLRARPVHAGPLLVYTVIAGDRRTPVRLDQVIGGGGVPR
jgi:hypothetical protein